MMISMVFLQVCKDEVIQIYSPTNDASVDNKDSIYELVQTEIDATPLHALHHWSWLEIQMRRWNLPTLAGKAQ